jgi:DNA-binding LacI/PurR family transcriptional regulator
MRKAGLSADNALIEPGDYNPQGGAERRDARLLLGSAPTAVFVANVARRSVC